MSFISIGDLSSSMRLRFLNASLKDQVGKLGNELATGKVSDLSKHLGGNLDQLGSINRSLKMLDAYRINTTEISNHASAMQVALETVQSANETTGVQSLAAANTKTATSISTAAAAAFENLQITVSALNSESGGQSLFAGQASKSPALISATDMLDELVALASSATTADQVRAIVDDYFNASGGGFETSAYQGSSTLPSAVRISETETAGISVSAASSEIRDALSGLATAALLSRDTILGTDLEEKSNLLQSAAETMLSATDEVITLRAKIGSIEERIETVATNNAARTTALQISLDEMTSTNSYDTATKLQAVETSLEALYIATTRISQLSLTRYMT